jgi:hypothetical protein
MHMLMLCEESDGDMSSNRADDICWESRLFTVVYLSWDKDMFVAIFRDMETHVITKAINARAFTEGFLFGYYSYILLTVTCTPVGPQCYI